MRMPRYFLDLAARIRATRVDRQLSRTDLARLAKIDRSTIRRLESGTHASQPHTLRQLADALETDAGPLLRLRAAGIQARSRDQRHDERRPPWWH